MCFVALRAIADSGIMIRPTKALGEEMGTGSARN
jgi:hypothetical protein